MMKHDQNSSSSNEEVNQDLPSQAIEELGAGQDPDARRGGEKRISEVKRFFVLRLASSWYAFPAEHVDHVGDRIRPTRVPTAPDHFLGVVHLRGRIVTIVDLVRVLGLTPDTEDRLGRRLVVLVAERVGFGVPSPEVLGLRGIDVKSIREPDEAKDAIDVELIGGEFEDENRVVTIINTARLLMALRQMVA